MDVQRFHEAILALAYLRNSSESTDEYGETLMNRVKVAINLLRETNENFPETCQKPFTLWTCTALLTLKGLANSTRVDTPSNLISIPQQKQIRTVLQMIFSLGVLPSMTPGVNIPLQNLSIKLNLHITEERTCEEKYNLLTYVLKHMLSLIKCPNLRSLILTHLRDLLAALLQVIECGNIKKPSSGSKDSKSSFVMTEEIYERLVKDRQQFTVAYRELTEDVYKPLVIKELMILLAQNKHKEKMTPVWLERAVTQQLNNYLLGPGGIALIMRALCPSTSETVDWKKVDTLSKFVSYVHGNLDPDHFYSLTSPQIIALLNMTGPYCIPIAKLSIKRILEHDPKRCNKFIFDKLFEPFIMCSKPVPESFSGTLISEESIGRCIDHIAKCFEIGSIESTLPMDSLFKIIKIKFRLYLKIKDSPYQYKTAVQDLLIRFLHAEPEGEMNRLSSIYNAFLFDEMPTDMLEMNEDLTFEFGPNGGVQVVKGVVKNEEISDIESQLDNSPLRAALMNLLIQDENCSKKLLHDLFLVLLTFLSESLGIVKEPQLGNLTTLMDVEEILYHVMMKNKKRIMTTSLLVELAENKQVIECITERPGLVIKFIRCLLERRAADIKDNDADCEEDANATDIFIALRLVDILSAGLKPGSETWQLFTPLIEPLKNVIKRVPAYRPIADPLLERLMVKVPINKGCVKKAQTGGATLNSKSSKNPPTFDKKVEKENNSLQCILNEICNDDIPTKGHGLITLRTMIEKSAKEIIPRKDEIFLLVRQQMRHSDSYVYLSATSALETFASLDADKVIELLCDEFGTEKKECGLEQLKIGEVLMRITRNRGAMSPPILNRLINTFLVGTKATDEMFRMSCLSNLGQVFENFNYSAVPVMYEVLICVKCIISTDPSCEVRRSALFLLYLLIKGLNETSLTMFAPVLKDLLRILDYARDNDKDEIVRVRALVALNEMSTLIKNQLRTVLPLEKKIGILSLIGKS